MLKRQSRLWFLPPYLLLFVFFRLIACQQTDTAIAETSFDPGHNFTQCNSNSNFTVYSVSRYFDPISNNYEFNVSGASLIPVTDLNAAQTLYASSRTEILLGFSIVSSLMQRLCETVQCPVEANINVTINQSISVPSSPLPLADIITRYSAVTADKASWACVTLAPVGYQHPTWQSIFRFIPVGFAVFAALVSIFASFMTVSDTDHDAFLFTSNYAMLPAALRLKTPGFSDIIYYAQFIVTTSQLSLSYPKFYVLFASNFAWSFLLFPTTWIHDNGHLAQQNSQSPQGLSFSKRQGDINPFALNGTMDDGPPVDVVGTGMNNFALASNVGVDNLFLTCLIFFLIILAGCALFCTLLWPATYLFGSKEPYLHPSRNCKLLNFSLGILLRLLTLFYLPLMTLSFYQLMLPSPWYMLLAPALVLVFAIFLLYGFIAFSLLHVRPPSLLFSDVTLLLRYGPLYNTFTDDRVYFFVVTLAYRVIVGVMVGGFQASGLVQIIVVLLAEIALVAMTYVQWPHASRQVNIQYFVFGLFRVLVIILSLTYVENLHVLERDKQAVAYVQVILHCIVFIIMFAIPIRNFAVIVTGLADEELYEDGAPPARMALWRRRVRKRPHLPVSTNVPPEEQMSNNRYSRQSQGARSSMQLLNETFYVDTQPDRTTRPLSMSPPPPTPIHQVPPRQYNNPVNSPQQRQP